MVVPTLSNCFFTSTADLVEEDPAALLEALPPVEVEDDALELAFPDVDEAALPAESLFEVEAVSQADKNAVAKNNIKKRLYMEISPNDSALINNKDDN
tara:strand:+ start:424 stop:717 length:294 start_codon:yes stop_codon:yes gene_type:complete